MQGGMGKWKLNFDLHSGVIRKTTEKTDKK